MSAGSCEIIPKWRKIGLVQEATSHEKTDTRDEATGMFWSKMSWMAAWYWSLMMHPLSSSMSINSSISYHGPTWEPLCWFWIPPKVPLGCCVWDQDSAHHTAQQSTASCLLEGSYVIWLIYISDTADSGPCTIHSTQCHTLSTFFSIVSDLNAYPNCFPIEEMIVLFCLCSRVNCYLIKLIKPGSRSYLWPYSKLRTIYYWIEDEIGSILLTLRLW
jgi:hypothetical protein